jgi:RNA polymerase sigma-70 factor, ECF subfamily
MEPGHPTRPAVPWRKTPEHALVADLPHQPQNAHGDLQLVRQLLARSESAWKRFVEQYHRLFVNRIQAAADELDLGLVTAAQAEEVCSEVLSQLVSREMVALTQYSGRSRLSTWLSVIVRRAALRYFMAARRRPRQPDSAEFDRLEQTDAVDLPGSDDRDRLYRGLQQLSDADRHLLELYYEQQRPYEHIASVFGITVNAVGPKLDRARKRLRRILESQPDL